MPPGLRSSVTETTSKPFGPHHWPNCSTSVHAFHTRSRGALNVRLMKNSNGLVRSPGFVVVLVTLLTSLASSVLARVGALERGDVEFLHLQERFRDPLQLRLVRVHQHFEQDLG